MIVFLGFGAVYGQIKWLTNKGRLKTVSDGLFRPSASIFELRAIVTQILPEKQNANAKKKARVIGEERVFRNLSD